MINKNSNGVTKQAISQFENGKANPSFETLLLLHLLLISQENTFILQIEMLLMLKTTYFRAQMSTDKKDRANCKLNV